MRRAGAWLRAGRGHLCARRRGELAAALRQGWRGVAYCWTWRNGSSSLVEDIILSAPLSCDAWACAARVAAGERW